MEFFGRRIEQFEESDQTQVNWCTAHDSKVEQLKNWLRKIKGPKNQRHQTTSKFIAVVMTEPPENETLKDQVGQAFIEMILFNRDSSTSFCQMKHLLKYQKNKK